nr:phage tail protein [Roseburia faecis]
MSLPPNLQNKDTRSLSVAFAKQMKKYLAYADRLNVWGNIDHLEPEHYDVFAACIAAPYYRSDFPDDKKLKLIKQNYSVRRSAGTQTAIDALLENVFDDARYIPWYEYGGKPYHFKVLLFDVLKENNIELMSNAMKKVKAARSIMDAVDIGRIATNVTYCGVGSCIASHPPEIREGFSIKGEDIVSKIQSGVETVGITKEPTIRENLKEAGEDISAERYVGVAETQTVKQPVICENYTERSTIQQAIASNIQVDSIHKNVIKEQEG